MWDAFPEGSALGTSEMVGPGKERKRASTTAADTGEPVREDTTSPINEQADAIPWEELAVWIFERKNQ